MNKKVAVEGSEGSKSVPNTKLSRLNVNIPNTRYRLFKAHLAIKGVTIQDVVEGWIEEYLENEKNI